MLQEDGSIASSGPAASGGASAGPAASGGLDFPNTAAGAASAASSAPLRLLVVNNIGVSHALQGKHALAAIYFSKAMSELTTTASLPPILAVPPTSPPSSGKFAICIVNIESTILVFLMPCEANMSWPPSTSTVFFFSKGSYLHDRPNSLLLVIEPVLFINLNICGRFWGKIGEFARKK
jgi:hypothetical protein